MKRSKEFKKNFDCDDVGKLIEFVGVKIVIDQATQTAKLTQPVLVQSFGDEFEFDQVMWIFQPQLDMSSVISMKTWCIWTPKNRCVLIWCWKIDVSIKAVLTRHQ
jgi:hypothetical protein